MSFSFDVWSASEKLNKAIMKNWTATLLGARI
jgi:hypothetical protein